MKSIPLFIGATTLALGLSAHAAVTGSLGGGGNSFLSLSSAGLGGGSVATLSGGTVYTADQPFADIPAGAVTTFLAAGPTSGTTATLNFTTPVDYLSFLWGSPDLYNRLTIISTDISQMFTVASLGFAVTDGDQTKSQYVNFVSTPGTKITGVVFTNSPAQDAFEVANFAIAAVPEASSFVLLAAGLGAIGLVVRRRRFDGRR